MEMEIKKLVLGIVHSNCYIVTDPDSGESVVIDPGAGDPALLEAVRPLRVRYILATHRHFDHVLGVGALKEITGAQVAIHERDACGLTDGRHSLASMVQESMPAAEPDILLRGGAVLPFANSQIEVLHTPGHTMGSVCFLLDGVLFSGDTLFQSSCGRLDLPTGSRQDMTASLRRLSELPGETRVLSGHGAESTITAEKKNNPYMKAALGGAQSDGR